uniref:Hexosyltransferase n=1 Tax=Ananas comosus var. bracteatus TaxID=296719 RepID=A0A6V7PID7_ANACO|nr:unnamed protein product [Ananas comosus var. bracteatus]
MEEAKYHWIISLLARLAVEAWNAASGLITFYNLTYPLDRSWHVLGLGYDPAVDLAQIESAAVIHYNGNYKPWLDLAITKYNSYWSKYVNFDNPYIQSCYMNK